MPGYIMDLRKLVGHRTLMQCAASIIIVNEKNQILLGKRTDNHKWGYAGGSIELDEKVEDCARRELFEETGLIADEIEFFMGILMVMKCLILRLYMCAENTMEN